MFTNTQSCTPTVLKSNIYLAKIIVLQQKKPFFFPKKNKTNLWKIPLDCNVYPYLQKNHIPDEKGCLNVEISVTAPELATTKRSMVSLNPILGLIFLGLQIILEHSVARVQSSPLILTEMSSSCTSRTSTAYAQIYLHYQSLFNDSNSWNMPDFGLIYDTHESADMQLNIHIRITETLLTAFLQL